MGREYADMLPTLNTYKSSAFSSRNTRASVRGTLSSMRFHSALIIHDFDVKLRSDQGIAASAAGAFGYVRQDSITSARTSDDAW